MWVIVVLFLMPEAHKVGSDQIIYQDKSTCEVGRMELLARLTATAPPEGRVFLKCVEMLGGISA